jgi:hypothetical protein
MMTDKKDKTGNKEQSSVVKDKQNRREENTLPDRDRPSRK